MKRNLPALLGAALREIRKSSTGTQDQWAERTGMSQSYLSAIERGQSGFDSVIAIAAAIERAGVDPIMLLRLAVAQAEEDEGQAELLLLWTQVDETTRTAILTLLRSQAAAARAAR